MQGVAFLPIPRLWLVSNTSTCPELQYVFTFKAAPNELTTHYFFTEVVKVPFLKKFMLQGRTLSTHFSFWHLDRRGISFFTGTRTKPSSNPSRPLASKSSSASRSSKYCELDEETWLGVNNEPELARLLELLLCEDYNKTRKRNYCLFPFPSYLITFNFTSKWRYNSFWQFIYPNFVNTYFFIRNNYFKPRIL